MRRTGRLVLAPTKVLHGEPVKYEILRRRQLRGGQCLDGHKRSTDGGDCVRRVVVMGQGYVGLPVAVRAAEVGYDVVGYDLDKGRVGDLASGRSFIEDISDKRLGRLLANGSYRPSAAEADLNDFDVAVISVPTPLREGVPDLAYIESAAKSLAPRLHPGATVILESTTWPGTTDELVAPILEDGSGLRAETDFNLGYSPERIDPGNPTWHLENTPKIVAGLGFRSLKAVQAFFDDLVEVTVPVPTCREAELAKLLENTFRHVNIALVNELAMFAEDLDIDIWATLEAAATKPFGFMKFTPGPGVGGHCLPIDPSYLSWRVKQSLGQPFRFVELANDINDHMPDYVVQRLVLALNERELPVKNRRIVVLGLAYKKNTGDARESPSRKVCEALVQLGAEVRAIDPHVRLEQTPEGVARADLSVEEIAAADAVVVLVDHDDFDQSLVSAHAKYVLDCRRWLPASDGVEYL
jgi:UDP-N-acetyl-D-glucosamine dehydrogenase